MFGRKNQNILSEHYTKLVDHAPVSRGIESSGMNVPIRGWTSRPDNGPARNAIAVNDFENPSLIRYGEAIRVQVHKFHQTKPAHSISNNNSTERVKRKEK